MQQVSDPRRVRTHTIPERSVQGYSLPVLGIGTSGMGSFGVGSSSRGEQSHDEIDIRALRLAHDAGFTHFDTAEVYAEGHAERLLRAALSRATEPPIIKITTKVLPDHLGYEDLLSSARGSRERLGRQIDTLLLHSPNHNISLYETADALRTLIDEGTVRHLGVSNHSVDSLDRISSVMGNDPRYQIKVCQAHYSLKHREPEASGLLEYCRSHEILFCAWRPLEKGIITTIESDLIEAMARKYQATPAQIALAWVMNQVNVTTLVRASSQLHLEENREATTLTLSPGDHESLTSDFPEQVLRDPRFPLG